VNIDEHQCEAAVIFYTARMSATRLPPPIQWLPISLAPEDCDLQVGTIGKDGVRPWGFPCRKRQALWFNVWANEPVLIYPTHWRIWR
jgi:hypothetical protein